MHPQQVVYQVQPTYPQPPAFFHCQKVTILVLYGISSFCLLAYMFLGLVSGLFFSLAGIILAFFLLLSLGHLFAGIYGAHREHLLVFTVHLAISILGALFSIGYAIYAFVAVKSMEEKRRAIGLSLRKGWESGGATFNYPGYEYGSSSNRVSSAVALWLFFSVSIHIAWIAFLVVFARNLRRWKELQKGGTNSGMVMGGRVE